MKLLDIIDNNKSKKDILPHIGSIGFAVCEDIKKGAEEGDMIVSLKDHTGPFSLMKQEASKFGGFFAEKSTRMVSGNYVEDSSFFIFKNIPGEYPPSIRAKMFAGLSMAEIYKESESKTEAGFRKDYEVMEAMKKALQSGHSEPIKGGEYRIEKEEGYDAYHITKGDSNLILGYLVKSKGKDRLYIKTPVFDKMQSENGKAKDNGKTVASRFAKNTHDRSDRGENMCEYQFNTFSDFEVMMNNYAFGEKSYNEFISTQKPRYVESSDAIPSIQIEEGEQEEKKGKVKKSEERIEDSGVKIGGARKDRYAVFIENYRTKNEAEILMNPYSKIVPEPNYDLLRKNGISEDTLNLMKAVRSCINPTSTDKLGSEKKNKYIASVQMILAIENVLSQDKTGEHTKRLKECYREEDTYKGYIDRHISRLMESKKAIDVLKENFGITLGDNRLGYQDEILKCLGQKADLIKELGGAEKVKNGSWWIGVNETPSGRLYESNTTSIKIGRQSIEREKVIGWLEERIVKKEGEKKKREMSFSVILNRGRNTGYVVPSSRKEEILAEVPSELIADPKKLFEWVNKNKEVLESIHKEIQDSLNSFNKAPEERIGVEYLKKGELINSDMFIKGFGLKGVEYGLWESQDVRKLNVVKAYNSLMDLSKLIGVSPKAISLNGELSLAFGSRGVPKARAHYEFQTQAINLTKENGQGSLAHEWFHALDHYLARHSGVEGVCATNSPEARANIRGELKECIDNLMKEIVSSDYAKRCKDMGPYWSKPEELAARAFQRYIVEKNLEAGGKNYYLSDYRTELGYKEKMKKIFLKKREIINVIPEGKTLSEAEITEIATRLVEENFKRQYEFPTTSEMVVFKKCFDKFFETLQEKEGLDNKRVLYRETEPTEKTEKKLSIEEIGKVLSEMTKYSQKYGVKAEIKPSSEANDEYARTRGSVKAEWDNGKVVIFSDRIKDAEDIKKSYLHEVVGHEGLRKVIGEKEFANVMQGLYEKSSPEQKSEIEAKANLYAKRTGKGPDIPLAVEEYLAEKAEKGVTMGKTGALWQTVKMEIKGALEKVGFNFRDGLKDSTVNYLLYNSQAKLQGKGEKELHGMLERFGAAGKESIEKKQLEGAYTQDGKVHIVANPQTKEIEVNPYEYKAKPVGKDYKEEFVLSKEALQQIKGPELTYGNLQMGIGLSLVEKKEISEKERERQNNVIRISPSLKAGELQVSAKKVHLHLNEKSENYIQEGSRAKLSVYKEKDGKLGVYPAAVRLEMPVMGAIEIAGYRKEEKDLEVKKGGKVELHLTSEGEKEIKKEQGKQKGMKL
jgi:hypothetical protein